MAESSSAGAGGKEGLPERYEILGMLGAGGMGRVFLAERADGAFEQQVALKILRPGLALEKRHADRFRREALAVLVAGGLGAVVPIALHGNLARGVLTVGGGSPFSITGRARVLLEPLLDRVDAGDSLGESGGLAGVRRLHQNPDGGVSSVEEGLGPAPEG